MAPTLVLPVLLVNPVPVSVVTPVHVSRLSSLLGAHPSPSLVAYVVHGFRHGFDLGYSGLLTPSRPDNLRSALADVPGVSAAILLELRRRHVAGPFAVPPFPVLHCSPLGAAPKPDGSVRLIMDLSSPRGDAVNEGIDREQFSVVYSSFDEAVRLVARLGSGAFLAKLDVQHAFRLCPVRLDQLPLLGFRWEGRYFVDTRLPFGSRSSPFIFTQFADLLHWILHNVYYIAFILHYLDDYFLCAGSREACAQDMSRMQGACAFLGVPLAAGKTAGPTQQLTYLGIEIDAAAQVVRLPQVKLAALLVLLAAWRGRKKCTKRELLSLIGSLSFAAKVVQPGRIFLRRLIELSTSVRSLHHFVTINAEAQADIAWWADFVVSWNGVSVIQQAPVPSTALHLFTDASLVGIGGLYGARWFSAALPPRLRSTPIHVLELFAILASVLLWGPAWRDRHIVFHTDNLAITQVWQSGSSRDPAVMRLVRRLFFFAAQHNIALSFRHIPGSSNVLADLLSRLQVPEFHRRAPWAHPIESQLPPAVWTIFPP